MELHQLIAKRFVARTDVKARQWTGDRDGYSPVREKFTYGDVKKHLAGDATYGHYMVNQDGLCKLAAFDLDTGKKEVQVRLLGSDGKLDGDIVSIVPRDVMRDPSHPARPTLIHMLRTIADGLEQLATRLFAPNIHTAISYSGYKGLHVYLFAPEPIPAEAARAMQKAILGRIDQQWKPTRGKNFYACESFPGIDIECFPKQDVVTDLGNLMRLPLGVHRSTGNEGFFIKRDAPIGVLEPMDPIEALKYDS